MKNMVLFWSTSVVFACPLSLFPYFFSFLFLLFFYFFFLGSFWPHFFSFFFFIFVQNLILTCGGIIVSIILSSLRHALIMNNDDHHTSIYLQLKNYDSILEQKYDSMWMPPAVYQDVQWSSITCMKNDERWLSHNYYVSYMIVQSNMTMNAQVMYMMMMEVAWQYILEWLLKCHNM